MASVSSFSSFVFDIGFACLIFWSWAPLHMNVRYYMKRLILHILCVFLTSCGMYDSRLAPAPPRLYEVQVGSVFLSDLGPDLFVESITSAGITVSWRNGQKPFTIPLQSFKSIGNSTYLEAKEFDLEKGTALIEYREADRRGFAGAWRF